MLYSEYNEPDGGEAGLPAGRCCRWTRRWSTGRRTGTPTGRWVLIKRCARAKWNMQYDLFRAFPYLWNLWNQLQKLKTFLQMKIERLVQLGTLTNRSISRQKTTFPKNIVVKCFLGLRLVVWQKYAIFIPLFWRIGTISCQLPEYRAHQAPLFVDQEIW